MNDISSKIKQSLLNEKASLIGFADIGNLPQNIRHSLDYAISIAVALRAYPKNQFSNIIPNEPQRAQRTQRVFKKSPCLCALCGFDFSDRFLILLSLQK